MKRALLIVALGLMTAYPVDAQQTPARRTAPPAQTQPAPPPRPVLPAEYERPVLELSETIGSLAFLTGLCRPAPGPNPWRRRMEELVESEGNANANREKLMGAYNQGFSAFSTTYRQCTDAARAARSVLVREAARLARDIERRYGG